MPSRPRTTDIRFRFTFWVEERGKGFHDRLFYCRQDALDEAVKESGIPDHIIRNRMGAGYGHLAEALAGKKLDRWAIAHIEMALSPLSERDFDNFSIPRPTS